MLLAAGALLILSLPFIIYRAIRGPEWSDRIIAGDLLAITLAAGLLILQLQRSYEWDREAIWLLIMIGFVGTIGASLLMEEEKPRG